jgi:hypothetical protein
MSAAVVFWARGDEPSARRLFDELERWAEESGGVRVDRGLERRLIVTSLGSVNYVGLRRVLEQVLTECDPEWRRRVTTREMETPKRIVLMCDYGADPLWSGEGGEMLALEYVPLSDETRAALRRWADEWDALRPSYEPPPPDDPRMVAHEAEGMRLWKIVREELGSDYLVGFREWANPHIRPVTAWSPEEVATD